MCYRGVMYLLLKVVDMFIRKKEDRCVYGVFLEVELSFFRVVYGVVCISRFGGIRGIWLGFKVIRGF